MRISDVLLQTALHWWVQTGDDVDAKTHLHQMCFILLHYVFTEHFHSDKHWPNWGPASRRKAGTVHIEWPLLLSKFD